MKVEFKGREYQLDGVMMTEARVLKRDFGWTIKGWLTALNDMDPDALAALVWIIRTRDGEKGLTVGGLDFSSDDLKLLDDDPAGDESGPTGADEA